MTTQMSQDTERRTRPGKFVWFEHASNDAKKAQEFYAEVLGWKVLPWAEGAYEMILAGDAPDSMVGGYTPLPTGHPRAHWISYVSVEDVDAAARAAAAKGGKVLEPPHEIPDIGRTTRIADPQGAELYLFKSASGDPPDPSRHDAPPARTFFWNELHTTDPAGALSFYEALIGFTHKTMNMGPGEDYHILESKDGAGRGGVTSHGQGGPHWLPYVAVDDPDATAARAKRQGGKVHVEPSDIPGVGRFAVIEDPTGAVLAVMKAMPPK
jgi:predicted enzyme related to lactoylglutathione lyase